MTGIGTPVNDHVIEHSIWEQIFSSGEVPAFALMGKADVEAAWQKYRSGTEAQGSSESWWFGQFHRAHLQEQGARAGHGQELVHAGEHRAQSMGVKIPAGKQKEEEKEGGG
jgi:hypothetical protein